MPFTTPVIGCEGMDVANRVPVQVLHALDHALAASERMTSRAFRSVRLRVAAAEAAADPGLWEWAEKVRHTSPAGADAADIIERLSTLRP